MDSRDAQSGAFTLTFALTFTLVFTLTFTLTFTLIFTLTFTLHLQIDGASSRSIERNFSFGLSFCIFMSFVKHPNG